MAHQCVSQWGGDDTAHGTEFRAACARLCVPEWAARATGELPVAIPDWREDGLSEEERRLLERTNKLLALAQSDNEHEAALAMQRVRELYARYNLDQAVLWETGHEQTAGRPYSHGPVVGQNPMHGKPSSQRDSVLRQNACGSPNSHEDSGLKQNPRGSLNPYEESVLGQNAPESPNPQKESVLRQECERRPRYVSWVHSFKSRRTEAWQSLILVILDRHFFVRTISFRQFDARDLVEYQAFEVMGTRENVVMAEYVFQFLERTLRTLWEKKLSGSGSLQALSPGARRSEKRHFLLGVLDGFMGQLDSLALYKNLSRSEKECVALVKRADEALNQFYRKKFPRRSHSGGSRFNPNRESYRSGVSAGRSLKLHKPVSGRDGNLGRLLHPGALDR